MVWAHLGKMMAPARGWSSILLLTAIFMSKWECKNKRQYTSKEEAGAAINRMNQESYGGVTDLRFYKCKFCKKFHLTSSQR